MVTPGQTTRHSHPSRNDSIENGGRSGQKQSGEADSALFRNGCGIRGCPLDSRRRILGSLVGCEGQDVFHLRRPDWEHMDHGRKRAQWPAPGHKELLFKAPAYGTRIGPHQVTLAHALPRVVVPQAIMADSSPYLRTSS